MEIFDTKKFVLKGPMFKLVMYFNILNKGVGDNRQCAIGPFLISINYFIKSKKYIFD